jgi:PhnB protein
VARLLPPVRDLRAMPRPEFKAALKKELHRRAFMSETAKPALTGAQAVHYRPPAFPNIAPYFIVADGLKFLDFLVSVFAGVERGRHARPDGTLMHAEVAIGDSVVELSDASAQFPARQATTHVYLQDADTAFARAIDAGATALFYPTSEHPSGDRWGALRDPFGNIWHIATPGSWALSGEQSPRSVQPYLHLHGAEKMIPFLEAAFNAKALGVHQSPEGLVQHATIEISGATLEIDEAHDEFQPQPCLLHVYVPDPDTLYEQALRAGATSVEAPQDKPYGERSAGVKDAFGNLWYVARYTGRPAM